MHQVTQKKLKRNDSESQESTVSGAMDDNKTVSQLAQGPGHSIDSIELQSPGTANNTGLPDNLRSGIELLSGYAMDDVKVHYNSTKPAQLKAHAYAQGTDIHLAPGQERHLPHEAWHVVQQKQGRVNATVQLKKNGEEEVEAAENNQPSGGDQASPRRTGSVASSEQNHSQQQSGNQMPEEAVQNVVQHEFGQRQGAEPIAEEEHHQAVADDSGERELFTSQLKTMDYGSLMKLAVEEGKKVLNFKTRFYNRWRNTGFTQLQTAIKQHSSSRDIVALCIAWREKHNQDLRGKGALSQAEKQKLLLINNLSRIHLILDADDRIKVSNVSNWQKTKDPVLKTLLVAKQKFNQEYRSALEENPITNVARNKMLQQLYVIQRASRNWTLKNKDLSKGADTPEKYLQVKHMEMQADELITDLKNSEVTQVHGHEFDALITSSLAEKAGRILPNKRLINAAHKIDSQNGLEDGERASKEELHDHNNLDNLRGENGEIEDGKHPNKVIVASYIRKTYNNLKDFDPSIAYKREKVTGTMADTDAGYDAMSAGMEMAYRNDMNKDFSLTSGSDGVGFSAGSKANAINQTAFTGNHSDWSHYTGEIKNAGNNLLTQLKDLFHSHNLSEVMDHLIRIGGEIHSLLAPIADIKEVLGDAVDMILGPAIWGRANHVADHMKHKAGPAEEHEAMMIELQEEVRWDAVYKAIMGLADVVSKLLVFTGAGAVAGIPMMAAMKATKAGVHVKTRFVDRTKYDEAYVTIVNGVLNDLKHLPRLSKDSFSKWHHAEIELYGIGVTVPELGSITKVRLLTWKKLKKLSNRKPSILLRDYLVDMQKARIHKSMPRMKH